MGEEVAERESKTKGMFAAFKEEFDKAKAGDEDLEEDVEEDVEEEYDEAADDEGEYEEPDDDEYEDEDDDEDADEEPSHKDPGIGGMFAAFKSEFDKAAKGE